MRETTAIVGLKALSCMFLASAAGFTVAIGVYSQEPWALKTRGWVHVATPHVQDTLKAANEDVLIPTGEWIVRNGHAASEWVVTTGSTAWAWAGETSDSAVQWAEAQRKAWLPPDGKTRVAEASPTPKPVAKPVKPPVKLAEPSLSQPSAAKAVDDTPVAEALPGEPPPPPAVDPNPPSAAMIAKVSNHVKLSLTKELFANFELFLYVSKAESGPWSQRMYVFRKLAGGDLSLAHTWPVSTGAEVPKRNPHGRLMNTETPPGFYQLDPKRMYTRYTSHQWRHPMPYAMFFNREKNGMKTGLAIHSADGTDIQLLGQRASAGCVRLAPQNAKTLFALVKKDYEGMAPRFAYDSRTATMSKAGLLMRDAEGKVKLAKGYKVLVFIENFGGEAVVAVLF